MGIVGLSVCTVFLFTTGLLASGATALVRFERAGINDGLSRIRWTLPLCVSRRIDTWQTVCSLPKEACPKILINKSEIKVP